MSIHSEAVKRTQRNKQAMLRQFKAERGCSRCSENHPACLDFHHRGDKHQKLSLRYMHGGRRSGGPRWGDMGYAEILREVAKCVILCANCHRKENSEAYGWAELPEMKDDSRRTEFLEKLRAIPGVTG